MALTVTVVGAGIGGLAAATALRRSGATVTIVEKAGAVYEVGAGLGLGPNAVGALSALGVADRLRDSVAEPLWSTRRRWADGSDLFAGSLTHAPQTYGYPFWFAHRGDLQAALLEVATSPEGEGTPVHVRLGTPVAGVEAESGLVRLASGETITADLVVAADGINSILRAGLLGDSRPHYTGHSGFRTQIEVAAITDPGAREIAERHGFESWLGPGAHVVHAPFRRGQMINVTACIETDPIEGPMTSAPLEMAELLERLAGWDEALLRLIAAGGEVRRYDIYVRPALERWAYGRVALLGDAAHPMLPYLGQGAAQAIEDGEALGAAFAGADADGVPTALGRYQDLRLERANRAQALSQANATTFHLPDGELQVERDRGIAQGSVDSDVTRWLWQYQDPAARLAQPASPHETAATAVQHKENADV